MHKSNNYTILLALPTSCTLFFLQAVLLRSGEIIFTIFHSSLIRSQSRIGGRQPRADIVINVVESENKRSKVEWDTSGQGVLGVAHGLYEVATGWREWVELWESYIYEMREYQDLGDWVLTVNDTRARGRGDIPVEMQSFQVWQVRDGKIVTVRTFLSEADALKAVGLEE